MSQPNPINAPSLNSIGLIAKQRKLDEGFKKAIVRNGTQKLRLALLGDAVVRLVSIRIGLKLWPDKKAGHVCQEIQNCQSNAWMEYWMTANGISLPFDHQKVGRKTYGDIFEAWVGYLFENVGEEFAMAFVTKYVNDCLSHESSTTLGAFTNKFVG